MNLLASRSIVWNEMSNFLHPFGLTAQETNRTRFPIGDECVAPSARDLQKDGLSRILCRKSWYQMGAVEGVQRMEWIKPDEVWDDVLAYCKA